MEASVAAAAVCHNAGRDGVRGELLSGRDRAEVEHVHIRPSARRPDSATRAHHRGRKTRCWRSSCISRDAFLLFAGLGFLISSGDAYLLGANFLLAAMRFHSVEERQAPAPDASRTIVLAGCSSRIRSIPILQSRDGRVGMSSHGAQYKKARRRAARAIEHT